MKRIYLILTLLVVCNWLYGQSQIITTGNNVIDPSNPYVADIVIGSDATAGNRHDGNIMFWSSGSASRIWNSGDVLNFSQWSTTTPNVGLNAAIGGTSFFQGNVGIGTSDPGNYRLGVNGTIHSKAVVVDLLNWPDYVFKPTYNLTPLSEIKTYIDQNHHLPEMPSEKEVAEKGLDLGEMNKLLTKKVEELTLYLIEKDKQLEEQKRITQSQEARLENIEQKLKTLNK